MALEDSSEDDSDDDSDDDKHERQQATEAITGHLDFDYNEVNLVKPSGQLQNRLRNLITQTWSILDEEYKSFGEYEKDYLLRLVKKKLEKEIQQLKLDLAPEPETPSSSRGSLPKDSQEELPQELDLAPEPEEDISEQLSKVDKLEQEINKLRSNELEQSKKIDSLQKQLEKFELFEKQIESLDLYKETIEKQITQLIKKEKGEEGWAALGLKTQRRGSALGQCHSASQLKEPADWSTQNPAEKRGREKKITRFDRKLYFVYQY